MYVETNGYWIEAKNHSSNLNDCCCPLVPHLQFHIAEKYMYIESEGKSGVKLGRRMQFFSFFLFFSPLVLCEKLIEEEEEISQDTRK